MPETNLAYEQLATCYIEMKKPVEAIKSVESSRETLIQMAARHGRVVARMARIQALLAHIDQNLCDMYDSDPVRYAGPRRTVATEAFEIADKLSLFQPLGGSLRIIYATQCMERAEYQEDDGEPPDLKAIRKGEQFWDAVAASRRRIVRHACLVMIRAQARGCAGGPRREPGGVRMASPVVSPGEGDANRVLRRSPFEYARRTGLVGRLPTRLTPRQLKSAVIAWQITHSPCFAKRQPKGSTMACPCERRRSHPWRQTLNFIDRCRPRIPRQSLRSALSRDRPGSALKFIQDIRAVRSQTR